MATPGPPIATEELLEHVEWLRRLALVLVRNSADASDLAHDAVAVALASPPQEPGPLRPWLAGVLRNLVRMRARGGSRREQREQASQESLAEASVPSPEDLVSRVQTQQLMARLVLDLDEPFRQTLLLRYYEGLSAAEIARRLDLPAGTVRWRLKNALDQLRDRLDCSFNKDRRHWMALLAPLAGASLAGPGTAAGPSLGLLGLLTSLKLAIFTLLALVLALLASLELGWPTKSERSSSPPVVRAVQPRVPGLARAAGSAGVVVEVDGQAVLHDDDPRGTLRLEGLVVDQLEHPVPGALVAIDTHPPRIVNAGDDGTFSIDGLIGRGYRLEARAGVWFGDIDFRLAPDSDPVIVHLAPAGRLGVEVRSSDKQAPVAGASIELRSILTWTGTTDAGGHVLLEGLGLGDGTLQQLHVMAPGYAPAALRLPTSEDPSSLRRQVVLLAAGAPVVGRVLDPAGRPLKGARVLAVDVNEPFPVNDPRRDAQVTDREGRFRFAAVAAGTVRLIASHEEYAPGASAALALDGTHAREVELRLERGGTVAGRVVDASGRPAAAAEVRVLARGGLWWRYSRDTVTSADGRFQLRGLPRRPLDAIASNATGVSRIASIELATEASIELTLTIDVTDGIEGVVVDPTGSPIGEAQVVLEPEWSGAAGEREAWHVRRLPRLIADAGGRFHATGLPAGRYLVRAARPGSQPDSLWLRTGTPAAAGDRDVHIMLPRDGQVTGRVLYDDGTAPPTFTVAVGPTRPVGFAQPDGRFSTDAPGGTFNVMVAGPTLEPRLVADVVVEGGVKDLGTITVKRGRSISGRVLDGGGRPVPGAKVAAGRLVTGGGGELSIPDEGIGVKEAVSDSDGRFLLTGFGAGSLSVVAGKDGVGRSPPLKLPRGSESVAVDLLLAPTGGLEGKLSRDGAPLAETVVICQAVAVAGNFFTLTGPDGSFGFDALAPGDYTVAATIGTGGNRAKDTFWRLATIRAGERAKVTIDAVEGRASLTVAVSTTAGAQVPAAQVIVGQGEFSAPTLEALHDGESARKMLQGTTTIAVYARSAIGAPIRIDGMKPGRYTACAVPLPVSPNDPLARQKLPDGMDSLPMKCVPVSVVETGAEAEPRVEIRVPAEWTTGASK